MRREARENQRDRFLFALRLGMVTFKYGYYQIEGVEKNFNKLVTEMAREGLVIGFGHTLRVMTDEDRDNVMRLKMFPKEKP